MPRFSGIIPPIITPLLAHDQLDREALERLIDRLIAAGVSGVFPLGTTGEGPVLSQRLQREVVTAVCQIAAARVPVLVGVTSTSFDDSVSLARYAAAAGATAIVAAPLIYFAPRPDDVTDYFTALAEASPLPLMMYDMPACVRADITFETAAACARVPNIVGIKDSSGDIKRFHKFLELQKVRPDWSFLIGPELMTATAAQAGGDGAVAGGANVEPELFVQLYRAAASNNEEQIKTLTAQARQLGRLYELSNDSLAVVRGVKTALAVRGQCNELLATPYAAPTSAEYREAVAQILAGLADPASAVMPQLVGSAAPSATRPRPK